MSEDLTLKETTEPFVRLDFLDSLRCFAIIYVVVSHLILIPQPPLAIPSWIAPLLINGGYAGVSLFFILSAFSLCFALDSRRSEPDLIKRFYLRRFFRIAPLFYLMLFIYWIRDAALMGVIHPISEVLINASLFFNLIPAYITGFVWASWTIGVMAILYLLFPLIYRWIRSLPAALILFIVSVLLSWGWSYFVLNCGETAGYLKANDKSFALGFGFLQHLPVFVCGVIIYRLFFDYFSKLNAQKRRMYGWTCLILFIPFYAVLLTDKLQNMLWGLSILHGFCLSLLVLGLGLKPLGFLINAKTSYLGRATYSMYLFHPLIIFSIIPVYRQIYNIFPNEMMGYLVSLLMTLAVLIPISLVSYKYIERTGIALGEKLFSRKLQGRVSNEQEF
ncbi:MAG: acyltransferase [Smithella sp.]|nr:acyltransferase [Smithella sp.]